MAEKNPERSVIEKSLAGLIPGVSPAHNPGIAYRIWEDLLEYWKNRAGGKVNTFEDGVKSVAGYTDPVEWKDKPDKDHPGMEFVPESVESYPHIHPREGVHYSLPDNFGDKLKEADDISDYEDYVERRLESIYEELFDLQSLPAFTDEEKKKLDKFAVKLGKFNHAHYIKRWHDK